MNDEGGKEKEEEEKARQRAEKEEWKRIRETKSD